MGRRNDLAGLAALGALGMILNKRGASEAPDMRGGAEDERPAPAGMGEATQLLSDRNEDYSNEGRTPPRNLVVDKKAVRKPNPVSAKKVLDQVSGGPRRGPAFETGSGGGRGPAFGEAEAYLASRRGVTGSPGGSYDVPPAPRRLSAQESLAQIPDGAPMDVNSDRGPNAVTGTDLSRNLSNTAMALTPISGGVGKFLAELPTLGKAQKAYNAQAAARRANEGLNATEAAAARDRLREASFEGGMKKGGKVKKSFSNKPTKTSASRRGDGIAMRGKTRGIMR